MSKSARSKRDFSVSFARIYFDWDWREPAENSNSSSLCVRVECGGIFKKNMTSRREYMRNPILLVQEAGIMIYARSSDLKIADLKRPDKPSTCHWYRSKHERSVRQPVFCLSMNYSMMSRIIHGVQDRGPGLNGGSPNEFNGIPIMRYCLSNRAEFLRNLYQLIATLIWLEYAKIQLLRPFLTFNSIQTVVSA